MSNVLGPRLKQMHKKNCCCEYCKEYSDEERASAFKKLEESLNYLWDGGGGISGEEHHELKFAQIAKLNAGLEFPIPAIIFVSPSRLSRLKSAFSCGFLNNNTAETVANDLLNNIRGNWTDEKGQP